MTAWEKTGYSRSSRYGQRGTLRRGKTGRSHRRLRAPSQPPEKELKSSTTNQIRPRAGRNKHDELFKPETGDEGKGILDKTNMSGSRYWGERQGYQDGEKGKGTVWGGGGKRKGSQIQVTQYKQEMLWDRKSNGLKEGAVGGGKKTG